MKTNRRDINSPISPAQKFCRDLPYWVLQSMVIYHSLTTDSMLDAAVFIVFHELLAWGKAAVKKQTLIE